MANCANRSNGSGECSRQCINHPLSSTRPQYNVNDNGWAA